MILKITVIVWVFVMKKGGKLLITKSSCENYRYLAEVLGKLSRNTVYTLHPFVPVTPTNILCHLLYVSNFPVRFKDFVDQLQSF